MKSKKEWNLSNEQRAFLKEMIQYAGFTKVQTAKMLSTMCQSKDVLSQQIMNRWLEKRSLTALKKWTEDFALLFKDANLSQADLKKGLLGNANLFFSSPETLRVNAADLQKLLKSNGIDLPMCDLINKHVIKSGLLSRSSVTITANVSNLIKLLEKRGVKFNQIDFIMRVFRDRPSVLMETPSKIAHNLDETARLVYQSGIPLTCSAYARASTRHPGLLYQSPKTICQHFSMLFGLYSAGLCSVSDKAKQFQETPEKMVQKILNDPVRLSLSDDNLASRWLVACKMKEEKKDKPSYYQLLHLTVEEVKTTLGHYKCPLERALEGKQRS